MVFHAELAQIWEKDSLASINMLQAMGIRGVGASRKSNIMKSTRNVVRAETKFMKRTQNTLLKTKTCGTASASINLDEIESKGEHEEDEDAFFDSPEEKRISRSALFDRKFTSQHLQLRTLDYKNSQKIKDEIADQDAFGMGAIKERNKEQEESSSSDEHENKESFNVSPKSNSRRNSRQITLDYGGKPNSGDQKNMKQTPKHGIIRTSQTGQENESKTVSELIKTFSYVSPDERKRPSQVAQVKS